MSSSAGLNSEALQVRIEQTIRHLQQEIALLQQSHQQEMLEMKHSSIQDLQRLQESFDLRLKAADEHHQSKIRTLEEEIAYLKELTQSQRLMMADNVGYIQELESKLGMAITSRPADVAGRS
jgi:hypothetical protein